MQIPDKNNLAETIRSEMGRKGVKSKDLAKALKVSQNTMSAVRYGNASYELMVRAINTLDKWPPDTKPDTSFLTNEEAIDLEGV
jgi:DNA-binding Xre family transcriptional regulator